MKTKGKKNEEQSDLTHSLKVMCKIIIQSVNQSTHQSSTNKSQQEEVGSDGWFGRWLWRRDNSSKSYLSGDNTGQSSAGSDSLLLKIIKAESKLGSLPLQGSCLGMFYVAHLHITGTLRAPLMWRRATFPSSVQFHHLSMVTDCYCGGMAPRWSFCAPS